MEMIIDTARPTKRAFFRVNAFDSEFDSYGRNNVSSTFSISIFVVSTVVKRSVATQSRSRLLNIENAFRYLIHRNAEYFFTNNHSFKLAGLFKIVCDNLSMIYFYFFYFYVL